MSTNELFEQRRAQMFPRLSPVQLARLEHCGRRIAVRAAEVLSEPGTRHNRLLVILSGTLEILLPGLRGETLVNTLAAGDFTGELSTVRGVAGFTRIRMREAGEVLAIDEESLRQVIQIDPELSELMMRAFILRRMGLVSSGQGEVTVIGSRHSAGTLQLREFLTRNAYPYASVDVDEDADVQTLLDRFQVAVDDIPVVIGHCGRSRRRQR